MGDDEKLRILIEAQNKAQKAFDEANKQIDDTEKKYKSMSDKMDASAEKMKQVGGKMTKYMTLPILAGAGLSIKAFSDLQETLNKTDVVFGKSSESVKKWSETSIQKMGMAQQSALDMVSLFGDMGTGMGLTQEASAKMGKELTQRAADMASFKNISFERAQTALAGIYTGETEALKGLGVMMTETSLNAYAVNTGFIKVEKNSTAVKDAALKQQDAQKKVTEAQKKYGVSSNEAAKAQVELEKANATFDKSMQGNISNLTEAEKIQLRYNLVMEQTKNSAGDFVETSDSLANKQRTAAEKTKQLSAELGGKLAPIYNKLLEVGTKVLDWFSGLSAGQQDLIVKAALVTAAIGPVVRVMGSLTKGITGTVKAGKQVVSATKSVASFTAQHGKAIASNVKFYSQYTAMMVKENSLKAAAKVKTIALTVAEKARMVATKIATAAQAAFNAVMSANPVFLVVAAIVALVAIMVVLYKKNEAVRNFIDKSWRAIAGVFMTVFNAIKTVVMGVFNWLKNNWKLVLVVILGPFAILIAAFFKYKDQIFTVFTMIWEIIKTVWNGIVIVIKWAWENVIKPIWDLLVAYITNVLIPIWKLIWATIQAVWNGIVAVIRWAWENVIKPIWDLLYAYITNVLIPIWAKIWEAIQAAWNFIKPIFEAIWAYIRDTLIPVFQSIWSKVSEVFSNVWSKILGVKDSIVGAFNTVKEAIKGLIDKFNAIKNGISNAFSGVKDAISSPFKSAFNAVAGFWNKTIGKVSFKAPSWVPGIGGKGFDFPNMPTLYKGMRNFGGGMAVVGDVRGQGGEIVSMPPGSDVYNNQESRRIMRAIADGEFRPDGNGGGTVNTFTGNIYLMNAEAVKEFFKQLERQGELSALGVAV